MKFISNGWCYIWKRCMQHDEKGGGEKELIIVSTVIRSDQSIL